MSCGFQGSSDVMRRAFHPCGTLFINYTSSLIVRKISDIPKLKDVLLVLELVLDDLLVLLKTFKESKERNFP